MSPEFVASTSEKLTYEDIARLDPLEIDDIMAYLPLLNRDADTVSIHNAILYALEKSKNIDQKADAIAALRDVDFLVSSLLRHGVQPLDAIIGLESEMIRLGAIAGTVPRGTVFTYAAVNPDGERNRSFTGTEEEGAFINAVREGVIALDSSVVSIGASSLKNDLDLGLALQEASVAMDTMIDSIVQVRRTVSPEFFSNEMRPYFDSLVIDGKKLTGSGGAQMQLLALDRVLWGAQEDDPDYMTFFNENLQYLTPMQQQALQNYLGINNNQTILDWLTENPSQYPDMREGAISLLKKIKKFRYPHRKVAQDNFKIRPDTAVGSGSYKPDILDILITKTESAMRRIEESQYA